jgi:hypothetical protein
VKNAKNYVVVMLFLVSLFAVVRGSADPSPQQQQQKSPQATSPTNTSSAKADEGQRRFVSHCGRSHQPPEDISPSEVKAVVRHMRERANLCAEDERLILKFLAP